MWALGDISWKEWVVDYFEVANWTEYQHYKSGKRANDPPWIKLYRRLMENYEFSQLADASKWHLCGVFLLAGRHNNKLPCDVGWLTRETRSKTTVDLQPLFLAGFIAKLADASNVLAVGKQDASPEEEEDEDEEPPTPETGEPVGFERFWKEWPSHRRKVARAQCLRHWKRGGLEAEAERIIAAVRSCKGSKDWQKDQGAFIPMPSTWLNQRRWEAVVVVEKRPKELSPAEKFIADRTDDEIRREVEAYTAAFPKLNEFALNKLRASPRTCREFCDWLFTNRAMREPREVA